MKNVIFVVWSLLLTWELTSCRDKVIISPANPVQFWLSGQSTYNETAVCSIEPVFWCQPWNCEDSIHIQFTDSTYFDPTDEVILKICSEDILLASLAMTRIGTVGSDGVYDVEFDLSDYDTCNKNINLFVVNATHYVATELLTNPDFTSDLSNWYQSGSGEVWAQSSGQAQSTINGSDLLTKRLINADIVPAGEYRVISEIRLLGFISIPMQVNVEFFTGEGIVYTKEFTVTDYLTENIEFLFTAAAAVSLGVRVYRFQTGIGIPDIGVQLNYVRLYNNIFVLKSDCQYVSDCNDCTELITFSNSNSFAGIDYTDVSPSREFTLRIPAVFFEEEFPDEYESIDLSNSEIVQLSSEVKHKKLLDVGWMPFYMIQKLQLVLAHDNVIIQEKNWIKGDGMTKIQGNKRYPLRRTSFLLTDKDFIKRNVL